LAGVVEGVVVVGGVTAEGVKVRGIVRVVEVTGIGVILSTPSGANGFGLPSVPSGISVILESCRLINALSEKTASSSFIFLTLKSKVKKSLATEESLSEDRSDEVETGVAEIKAASGDDFIKNM
jgi:hypothetical protein